MQTRLVVHRFFVVIGIVLISVCSLLAQTPAWQPAPGHVTLPLWPHGAPGAALNSPAEVDTTTAKENLIAGKRVVRLGNVSAPTLTVYSPAAKNSGAAIVVFPGGAIAFWQSISRGLKCVTGSHRSGSLACW